MGSRFRKLLAAGLILAIGFGLAWPFRRQAQPSASAPESPAHVSASTQSFAPPFPSASPDPQPERLTAPIVLPPDRDPVAPTTTSIASASHHPPPIESHADKPVVPPLASQASPLVTDAVAPTPAAPASRENHEATQRPVYATEIPFKTEAAPATTREPRIHVVHNGDTLARLAPSLFGRRYPGHGNLRLEPRRVGEPAPAADWRRARNPARGVEENRKRSRRLVDRYCTVRLIH